VANEISPHGRGGVTSVGRPGKTVRAGEGAAPTARRAPVHDGIGLHLDQRRLRAECWSTLGPKLVGRLYELSGDVIDWYALDDPVADDGRVAAGVLGTRGFTVGLPRWNERRQPVYSVVSFQFDPTSHRQIPVQGYGGAGPDLASLARPGPHTGGTTRIATAVPGLDDSIRGELGNLPLQAQELLQAPFINGDEILRSECRYEGFVERLDSYILVLAGRNTVTAAVGGNYVPAGGRPDAPHWTLMCHRFAVLRRIGQ
jgi:hypothetical protein